MSDGSKNHVHVKINGQSNIGSEVFKYISEFIKTTGGDESDLASFWQAVGFFNKLDSPVSALYSRMLETVFMAGVMAHNKHPDLFDIKFMKQKECTENCAESESPKVDMSHYA